MAAGLPFIKEWYPIHLPLTSLFKEKHGWHQNDLKYFFSTSVVQLVNQRYYNFKFQSANPRIKIYFSDFTLTLKILSHPFSWHVATPQEMFLVQSENILAKTATYVAHCLSTRGNRSVKRYHWLLLARQNTTRVTTNRTLLCQIHSREEFRGQRGTSAN